MARKNGPFLIVMKIQDQFSSFAIFIARVYYEYMILDRIPRFKNSSFTDRAAAFAVGLLVLFILLLTATEALCFWIPNWWRNEYANYDTPSNVRGEMSLDDAVHVTEDMLDYCVGRLDTLDNSEATIDGVKEPFFTNREKQHLYDCRVLFMKGMRARSISIILSAGLILYIYVHNRKKTPRVLARGYLISLACVLICTVVIAIASAINFTFVFTVFHKIFFNNDLWILYPDEDNLINIMQENVFSDAAMWIAGMWIAASTLLAAISLIVLRKSDGSAESEPNSSESEAVS